MRQHCRRKRSTERERERSTFVIYHARDANLRSVRRYRQSPRPIHDILSFLWRWLHVGMKPCARRQETRRTTGTTINMTKCRPISVAHPPSLFFFLLSRGPQVHRILLSFSSYSGLNIDSQEKRS